jgi:phage terminase small subunit
MAKLLVRERRFIAEYLLDLDEGRAALAAGYPAAADGKRLLHKRAVAAVIQQGRERQNERLRVDGERILREWARVGFANARTFFPPVGATVDLSRLTVDDSAAVAEFQIDEQEDPRTGQVYRRTKVRLHDKLRALSDLARATGLLREETTLTIEHRIKQMTPGERLQMADELLERGRQYLPLYEQAVRNGEVIEAPAEEVEEGASQAPPPEKQ